MQEDFWQDIEKANAINKELSTLKKIVEKVSKIETQINDNLELIPLLEENEISTIEGELSTIQKELEDLELNTLLNGPYDNLNCYLEIHPGAGGTESCDWASMLLRMYKMFCEKNDFTYDVIEEQAGEEAGIKSATIYIKGEYAFGYLKNEKGVHRLVRISPFDAGARRHTSFASVSVTPEYNTEINLEIKESDLKIDVYHSSGAGGQSVNTSNSAVRITHLPTNTVVTCQNERSQLKNKDKAMQILKVKLYDLMEQEKEQALGSARKSKIGTGDRSEKIRTYNYPQNRVTDHRIGFSVMSLDRVMDGELDPIIEALITEDLKRKLAGE